LVEHYKDELEGLGEADEADDDVQAEVRKTFEGSLEETQEAIETLNEFHDEVTNF
jgi:hypothetical protein